MKNMITLTKKVVVIPITSVKVKKVPGRNGQRDMYIVFSGSYRNRGVVYPSKSYADTVCAMAHLLHDYIGAEQYAEIGSYNIVKRASIAVSMGILHDEQKRNNE